MLLHRTTHTTGKNSCYAGIEVRISREDFIKWFMANDFEGCSVDRIRPTDHYEVGNLQMLTLPENVGKDKRLVHENERTCNHCGELKPIEDFVKCSRSWTGRISICKPCEVHRTRLRQQKSLSGCSSGR